MSPSRTRRVSPKSSLFRPVLLEVKANVSTSGGFRSTRAILTGTVVGCDGSLEIPAALNPSSRSLPDGSLTVIRNPRSDSRSASSGMGRWIHIQYRLPFKASIRIRVIPCYNCSENLLSSPVKAEINSTSGFSPGFDEVSSNIALAHWS